MKELIVIAHNIRSTHNVGAILRSADAFGVDKVIVSGYTPYPRINHDHRLPHIIEKNTKDIAKSALGAEQTMLVELSNDITSDLADYASRGYEVIALEQHSTSQPLMSYRLTRPTVLLLGEERYGIDTTLLAHCNTILEIPMMGAKESLNVSVAAGICLYQLRHGSYILDESTIQL